MSSVDEKLKTGGLIVGEQHSLFEGMKLLKEMQDHAGMKKSINSELWHACAGPLVSLPQVGSLVFYFPQGHSEQVALSTNRPATVQTPNYPNLPSQLLCQVHNATLHADKETDEIYAQMSLQPVNTEKDVFPIPNFGLKPSKHPNEFFCKILTASDTSTHGGFSVPRRAAEKLFPQLDYAMQPPTQELVVRDLHDNTWTFRHIYRGQPKRHLLTTGWSMFVGAKRLRAGDSVLFIRDEKSQLLLGVRRANRQQTALPSSVLSADSMHIGILAAAAHASANRSPFTIFYNPRACPSEFVIPLTKFRKAMYGSQLSIGMRFGMMFETEESSKRRYMGTILGISDIDPLRWPSSKWRSVQVEWDEPGCGDKQNRVSPWEIETPESLFIFPSLPSNLKRPSHSAFLGAQTDWVTSIKRPFFRVPDNSHTNFQSPPIPSYWSDQLMKMLIKQPQGINTPSMQVVNNPAPQERTAQIQSEIKQKSNLITPDVFQPVQPVSPNKFRNQTFSEANSELPKLETLHSMDQFSHFQSQRQCNDENAPTKSMNLPNAALSDFTAFNTSPWAPHQQMDTLQIDQVQYPGQIEFNSYPSICPPSESFRNSGSLTMNKKPDNLPISSEPVYAAQELWDPSFTNNSSYNSCGLKDLSDESHNQSDIYSCFNGSNSGSTIIDPSIPNMILDDFCPVKNTDIPNPPEYFVGNFCSNQDVQSQITSASLADSQTFSVQEYADNSGGASSSNVEFDDGNLLLHSSWQKVNQRFRTYTKIQKAGSVGRSIDVSLSKNYDELRSEIERMFGLEGLLNDSCSGWKLVYVDFENDVLLIGDDPWKEFVGCVRCIRILSPSEVQKMGEEGMQLLNSAAMQGVNAST